MRLALIVALALMAGCVTQQLDRRLQSLVGSNLHAAVDAMGEPDGEDRVNGEKNYYWSTNQEVSMEHTTISQGTDIRGITTSSATTYVPVTFTCTVQVATAEDGTIKTVTRQGTQGVCQRFARRVH